PAGGEDTGAADGRIERFLDRDLARAARRGAPEAVLCGAKSVEQVAAIAAEYARLQADGREDLGPVLFTRADAERAEAILAVLPEAHHDPSGRLLAWPDAPPEPTGGLVVVARAATSGSAVAR